MASLKPKILRPDALRILRETTKALREYKKVDPRERYVLLYPDSEQAHMGMGFNLLNCPPAEETFARASDIVNKNVLKLCLEGPREDLLNSLENRNICAFVTSHATIEKLRFEKPKLMEFCKAAGGVGIGFVNSLVFCGSISFENGLDLVKRQGQAMDKAASLVESARLKLRLAPATRKHLLCRAAQEHCEKLGIPNEIAACSITKQTHPHNVEIGGHIEAIKFLETEGVRLFKFLAIQRIETGLPYAFHTKLMLPAQEFIRGYIKQRIKEEPDYIKAPDNFSLYSSTLGRRIRNVDLIVKDLVNYSVSPLRIEQMVMSMFRRPADVRQPNIFVIWDRRLMRTLRLVHRKAADSAKMLQ